MPWSRVEEIATVKTSRILPVVDADEPRMVVRKCLLFHILEHFSEVAS